MIEIDKNILELVNECERECESKFKIIEQIEFENQLKVLNAFNQCAVQAHHFIGSTGYGHNDIGKAKICEIFANVFHTESSFVSPLISCGTEAITHTLFGLLRPGDNMLVISGTPYDTLKNIIYGIEGQDIGSLKDYKIKYREVALKDNDFDLETIKHAIEDQQPTIIYIQRSRGYSSRNALTITQIEKVIQYLKTITKAHIVVDNCYGELTETREPTDVGADVVVGSLLKNLGGGIAPTGGYIAGRSELVEKIVFRITSPALGADNGSYELGYKAFFEGIFIAPHVVAQALKIVALASRVFYKLNIKTIPTINDVFSDIVLCIQFNDKQKLLNFTRAIQQSSAVDSNSSVEAGEMDGYEDLIIMASGSFNQGSSIELSCDGPMREPYSAFMQGGLTYTHGKLALLNAVKTII